MLTVDVYVTPRLREAPSFVSGVFEEQLFLAFQPVASVMLLAMKAQLVPGHGYDTGRLHDSLTIKLVRLAANPGFDIVAQDVDYWAYVEFGHMQRDGNWWEGYHYAATALRANMDALQGAARVAWKMTAAVVNRSGFSLPDF